MSTFSNSRIVLWLCLGLTICAAAAHADARLPADLLLVADHVVTMDGALTILEPGAVAIRGDTVVAVGRPEVLRREVKARRTETLGDRWVMPGLINLHAHIAMNPMRGVADDMKLMEWLQRYIFPLEARLVNARFVYEASLLGNAEMISRGITAVVDMYYFEGEVARAVRESGLRGWLGQTVIDFKAPDFATPDESLQYTEAEMRRWQNDALVKIIPAPHSGYTCSPETLRRTKELAARLNSPLTFHLSESASEVADIRDRYGVTPTEHAARIGLLGRRVLAAHCVQLTPADLDLLQQSGTAVAHNPDSNLKLASGLAPVAEMRRRGIPVGLGTDGAASNNRLDLFAEMRLAALLAKGSSGDAAALPAAAALKAATLDGARALNLDARIGSIAAGKRADLVAVDLHAPSSQPLFDPVSHLVYVAGREHVTHVWVDGRLKLADRRLVDLEPDELGTRAAYWRSKLTP